MTRARIAPALALAMALVALLAVATGCNQTTTTELPEDLLALLPADPAMVVTLTSLNDYDARRAALADSSQGTPLLDGGALAKIDLSGLLGEMLPAVAAVIARDRPLAVAVGVPAPMTNQLDVVLVMPVLSDIEVGDLTDGDIFESQLARGEYLALSAGPAYAAPDSLCALGLDRLPGMMSVAIDLEGILKMYRPLVEMGLMAMSAQGTGPDGEGAMSPAEAAATADMTRLVMDAARRLDLTVDLDTKEVKLVSRLDLMPESVLVPATQPDFDQALDMSGSLPAGAHLTWARAMDQRQYLDISLDYYRAAMEADLKHLPPDLAADIAAWFDGYIETTRYLSAPTAMSVSLGLDGIEGQIILQSDEATEVLAHIGRQMELLGKLDIGLTVTPTEPLALADVPVQGWDFTWDDERMAAILDVAEAADIAPTGGQLAQTLGILRRLAPGLRGFATDGKVVLTTTTDWEQLGVAVADIKDPRAPDEQLAALAAAGGPNTREVVQGNIGLLLVWMFEAMGVDDPELIAELQAEPLEMTMVMTQTGPRFASTFTLGVSGLRRSLHAIHELGDQMKEK